MSLPHGFTPVARNPAHLKPKHENAPAISIDQLLAQIPDTPLVQRALKYLEPKLPQPVMNHSKRAFLYGVAIATVQFPEWSWDAESYYLACLFHDLGCIPESLKATKLSFEFYGAFLTRQFLAPDYENATQDHKDLVDSVTEAICRHTNFIDGKITTHGCMIQLGTLYDNAGATPTWVHIDTAKAVVAKFPRHKWTQCFHDAMKDEVKLKPWSHTTFFDEEGIWDKVLGNAIAKPMEQAEANAKI